MYVRQVELTGFMPYRDRQAVKFDCGQVYGITGQYGEDYSRSNRAGKSSFIDAIRWCLFGESRAMKEIELIHTEADFAEVECELFDILTDRSVWVRRYRDKDNKGALEVRGTEGEKKRVTQEEVNKLIGLDSNEFEFTAFFKQNDIDQFMEADPQEKKKILMRWLQTTNWAVYQLKAAEYKKGLTQEQTKLKAQIAGLPEIDFDTDDLKEEANQIDKNKKTIASSIDKFARQRIDLNLQIKELKTVKEKKEKAAGVATKIQQLKNRRPDSSQHAAKLKQLDEALAKYPTINKERYDEAVSKRDSYVSQIGSLNYEINDVDKKIRSFGKEMTGVCPILNTACSRIEPDPDQLNQLKLEKAGLEKKLQRVEDNRDKANKILKLYLCQQDWLKKKEALFNELQYAKQIESQIADLSKERTDILKSIPEDAEQKIQECLNKIDELSDSQEELNQEKAKLDGRLGEIREMLNQAATSKDRLQAYKNDLEKIERDLADVQYVEYMFGKNGIPSMELENSFQEIEHDANLILGKLRAPFHMEFEATRELGEWEPNCLACGVAFEKGERTHKCKQCGSDREKKRRDELSLKVYEQGIERAFYMDSGGGKVLLSVAIRLALTLLARRRVGSKWGTVFLDEVFGSLDQTNRRILSDLITSTLLSDLGFEQVFVISHDQNIQTSFANQLVVRRNQDKGFSELRLQ